MSELKITVTAFITVDAQRGSRKAEDERFRLASEVESFLEADLDTAGEALNFKIETEWVKPEAKP